MDWLERCHLNCGPCGSPFEESVDSALLMKAGLALDWAQASDGSVELFATTVNVNSLLAGLVFRRADVTHEDVYRGALDDGAFERLTRSVSQISRSGLAIRQGYPSPGEAQAAFFGPPLYALLTH